MNTVINSFINTVKKIKSEIFGKISDFIFLHVEKIKSEIFWKISDFIFLYAEKIKSEIFVPFGHRINSYASFEHLAYARKYRY